MSEMPESTEPDFENLSPQALKALLVEQGQELLKSRQDAVKAQGAYDEAYNAWKTQNEALIAQKQAISEQVSGLEKRLRAGMAALYAKTGAKEYEAYSVRLMPIAEYDETAVKTWLIRNAPPLALRFLMVDKKLFDEWLKGYADDDGLMPEVGIATNILQNNAMFMPIGAIPATIKKTPTGVIHTAKLGKLKVVSDSAGKEAAPAHKLKLQAAERMRHILKNGWVLFDTETTGLAEDAEIIQFSAVNSFGESLNLYIKPQGQITPGSTAIHGITAEKVADAPSFVDVYEKIRDFLENPACGFALAYNLQFDHARLQADCARHNLPPIKRTDPLERTTECVMLRYAEFHGERNDYYNSYRWQKLVNACEQVGIEVRNAHDAMGDVLMAIEVMKKMAEFNAPVPEIEPAKVADDIPF